ncbi:unnamed protein product [Ceratitis capitata]|uniref:(Mediterranean fruit fly) hypothetical protein n=1 Tax=Ceratitis capitata TaxID=7213 RepID=A0A811U8S8_CERCA|nr:unnamed protein product [Ceratitis capitata]
MSAKEETSKTSATTAATTVVAPSVQTAAAAATTSYANVLQNLETKQGAIAKGGSEVIAVTDSDNKENQPHLKTIKSWSEEAAAAEAANEGLSNVVAVEAGATVAGEKRSAITDAGAENSSEIDDNTDFVPVVSHHRRDRKNHVKISPSGVNVKVATVIMAMKS